MLCSKSLLQLSSRTACELLAGSLLRSAEWHGAVFYPLGREPARQIISDWLEILDGAAPVNPADRCVTARLRSTELKDKFLLFFVNAL